MQRLRQRISHGRDTGVGGQVRHFDRLGRVALIYQRHLCRDERCGVDVRACLIEHWFTLLVCPAATVTVVTFWPKSKILPSVTVSLLVLSGVTVLTLFTSNTNVLAVEPMFVICVSF